jgi:hypothetical protein
LANLTERFGVGLHTYVLMSNHYHLQIETPRLNLSGAIKWLNLSYVSWFNRKSRRNGPLLQGRFKAVVHDPAETGWTIHEYIHLNPVLIAQRYGGMSLREIGEAVGGLRYPAVSDAIRRTSARLEIDGVLDRKFKRLRKILKL